MKSLYSILFVCLFLQGISQEFAIEKIPLELREGMDAVIRNEIGIFEIQSLDKARFSINRTITILNEKGDHNAYLQFFYDNLISISSLSAEVYDSQGNRIEKVRKSDFIDESAISGGSFFDDSREITYDLRQDSYPYTVKYQIEYLRKYTYTIPSWYFLKYINESVEASTFIIKSPQDIHPRYLTWKAEEPIISKENDLLITQWKETNLKGIEQEPYDARATELYPKVITAPSKFEFEGYTGDMTTWEGMAKWQIALNKGRDELPASTIQQIQDLTNGLSREEKIKKIYEYVQSNTRYVSVQLGVGGLQPMPAKLVDEEGYGDCKALTFYTKSLLQSVGIASNYTLVDAGSNPREILKDFPGHYFNHVILSVPSEKDTIWLECTSQTIPFGFLGDFTSDREVFMITEDGGKIVRTPTYSIEDNYVYTKAFVDLFEDGNAKIKYSSTHSGLLYDDMRGLINTGRDNQKKILEKSIKVSSFILEDFQIESVETQLPKAHQQVDLVARNLTSKSGTRFFLQPNLLNKNKFIPVKDSNRERPIHTNYSFIEIDTISYTLPENYNVEAFFDPIDFSSAFGKYHSELSRNEDGTLVYIRKFEKYKGVFEPSLYEEYTTFYKKIVRADKKRISFKKKT